MRPLVLVLLLALGQVHAESSVRYVFKGGSPSLNVGRMTFGLSDRQVRNILALTDGEVDFGDVYFVDAPAKNLRAMSVRPWFSGAIYPNVPPPGELTLRADPELRGQYWIDQLNVPGAWKLASGKGVTIADCDAGYAWKEPDLRPNVFGNLAWDFSDPANPTDVNDGPYRFHGTAVAAIMLAVVDARGTNGIAYNSKLVPFQNANYDDSDKIDKEEATAECILKAIRTPDVSIIVLENQTDNGSSETFAGTRDAVRLALKSGITVVGAGGNASVELTEEERYDTGSIIVGAIDRYDRMENYSNYGSRVTVAAYGSGLHTLYGPNGEFGEFAGTSGATPQVAATVALMQEVNPLLTPTQIKTILTNTRVTSSANRYVGGRLDTLAAVKSAAASRSDAGEWGMHRIFRSQLIHILDHP